MNDLILLSPRSDEENSIIEQWKDRSKYCEFVDKTRITLETDKGHLFIDVDPNEVNGEDHIEYLTEFYKGFGIDLSRYTSYCIGFRDVEFLKYFLRETKFTEGCKFDNDLEIVVDYKDLFTAEGFFDYYTWGLKELEAYKTKSERESGS